MKVTAPQFDLPLGDLGAKRSFVPRTNEEKFEIIARVYVQENTVSGSVNRRINLMQVAMCDLGLTLAQYKTIYVRARHYITRKLRDARGGFAHLTPNSRVWIHDVEPAAR